MIRAGTIWSILGIACTVIAAILLAAWLLGRVASDRFAWSQWLLWMPTPAVLPAVGLGLAGACRPAREARQRRRRLAVWAGVGAVLASLLAWLEVVYHRKLHTETLASVSRVNVNSTVATLPKCDPGVKRCCRWQYQPIVVVRVLTHQVHARRSATHGRCAVELLLEAALYD